MDHHGHGDVEVEEGAHAAEAAQGDCGVVADDCAADHDEGFGDDGVDLAGHDAGAGLDGGEDEFAYAAAGAGAEPADVVGDFAEADGDGFEDAAGFDDGVFGGLGLEVIGGFAEVDTHACGEFGGDHGAEFFVGVDAGADGCAADGEFGECVEGAVQAFFGVAELGGEAAEFLAEADGCGVGEVGAADFDNLVPGGGFGLEVGGHCLDGGEKAGVDGDCRGEVHRGREGVVGRLAGVDVVVGVDAAFVVDVFEVFGGADGLVLLEADEVGDDLVDVHIGGCAAAGLVDVDGEVFGEAAKAGQAVVDFVAGFDDGLGAVFVEAAELVIDGGAGGLEDGVGLDDFFGDGAARDGEVEDGTLGGGAVEGVGRDLHFAHGVFFGAGGGGGCHVGRIGEMAKGQIFKGPDSEGEKRRINTEGHGEPRRRARRGRKSLKAGDAEWERGNGQIAKGEIANGGKGRGVLV